MDKTLYLIPCTLGESPVNRVLPEYTIHIVNEINTYIVENERSARRFLIKLGIQTPIDDLTLLPVNEHTSDTDAGKLFLNIKEGPVGLLSEAGVPCVADPGKSVVLAAHKNDYKVVPLVGPSSILLGIMASGLNGQNFAFNGYLPVKSHERIQKIKFLENRSVHENQSQLFMEAPYRNNQLLTDILKTCSENTLLTIACELTTENEFTLTLTIKEWKGRTIDLHKKPTIFGIQKY